MSLLIYVNMPFNLKLVIWLRAKGKRFCEEFTDRISPIHIVKLHRNAFFYLIKVFNSQPLFQVPLTNTYMKT